MLMVLLTVLNIMIAASLPAWSALIRRDKEEELIFRGLQYAEAIRIFKNRFQRDPVRLEELIEVKPRSIRRLWKDPMTDDGKWSLISAVAPNPVQVQPPGGDQQQNPPEGDDAGRDEQPQDDDQTGGDNGFGPKKDEIQVGPFKGVHSRSRKTSFLLFNGKNRYDEWHFTVDLFTGGNNNQGQNQNQVPPNPQVSIAPGQPQMSARWIGRPLPEFLLPRQGSGLPQDDEGSGSGQDPNGRPRVPRKP
jgi:type II secretory pathway pseudopilin PulG